MLDRACIFTTSKKLFRFRQNLNKDIRDIVPDHIRLQLRNITKIDMNINQLRGIRMLERPIHILWHTVSL
jgi:hypothetical protein